MIHLKTKKKKKKKGAMWNGWRQRTVSPLIELCGIKRVETVWEEKRLFHEMSPNCHTESGQAQERSSLYLPKPKGRQKHWCCSHTHTQQKVLLISIQWFLNMEQRPPSTFTQNPPSWKIPSCVSCCLFYRLPQRQLHWGASALNW